MPHGYRYYGDNRAITFITSTVVDWIPLFISHRYCQIIMESLGYCRRHKGLRIHAYVVMPTHIHLIVSTDPPSTLPDVVRDLKRYTSRALTACLEEDRARALLRLLNEWSYRGKGNTEYKVWQDGYHPKAIFTQWFLRQKLDYLHDNPVRKGLVRRAEDWVYSSAAAYLKGERGMIEIDRLSV